MSGRDTSDQRAGSAAGIGGTEGAETAWSAAASATPAVALGSRAHVRATLDRAREAVRASRERTASSHSALARAGALAGASERLLQESVALRALLRASVTAYVRHLRGEGLPPERMLVLVKDAVREAAPPELDPREARELMEDVVRWSVEAYYQAA